MEKPQREI